jgi:hypothetical protein
MKKAASEIGKTIYIGGTDRLWRIATLFSNSSN